MARSQNDLRTRDQRTQKKPQDKTTLTTMRKGYKEMADINLSISTLCFEVEREVETYYDRIAESE